MAPKNGRMSVLNKTLGRVIKDSGFSDSRVSKLLSSLRERLTPLFPIVQSR